MKTKYVEPKGYFNTQMEKAFKAGAKKTAKGKTTSTKKSSKK